MRLIPNRVEKLALLSKIVEGRLTDKVIDDIRKSREPIHLTLNLGDEHNLPPRDPDEPTYHINVSYGDGQTTSQAFWKFPDGRIEYVENC